MKIIEHDGKPVRRFIQAIVTDPFVLGQVSALGGERELFNNMAADQIVRWSREHYLKFGKPPGKGIVGYYERWLESNGNEKLAPGIDVLLAFLSDGTDWTNGFNPEHLTAEIKRHVGKVKLEKLSQDLARKLEAGQTEEAEALVSAHFQVDMGDGEDEDVLTDENAIESTFDETVKPILDYPGVVGAFLQGQLERDAFIAFLAPNKTGKSFWLMDMAYRAVRQRRRVLFILAGDMSRKQWKRRLYSRASRHPYRSPRKEWPYLVRRPLSVRIERFKSDKSNADRHTFVESEEQIYKFPLGAAQAKVACKKVVKSNDSFIKLRVYPKGGINTDGIRAVLQRLEHQGWIADLVVVDYADNLGPPAGTGKYDFREQTNHTWAGLRTLSMDKHCLLLTATQANTDSYEKTWLTWKNFSEDRRKLDHVTGMIGLNVCGQEKVQQVTRLNWVRLREGEANDQDGPSVAGCLPICNPCVRSCWWQNEERKNEA